MKDSLKTISSIISEKMGLSLASVKPTSNLVIDLDIDSLSEVLIFLQLEDECGIDIPNHVAEGFNTVQDIVDYIVTLSA